MIKLLAISASPVVESSTDYLLQHLLNSVTSALNGNTTVESRLIRLNDLTFVPCQACGEAPTPKYCFYDDDLAGVYNDLVAADCVLFGSPIYFDSVSAQAKMFIDRCNCLRPADFNNTDPEHDFIKLISKRRPGAMVLVGGQRGWFEGARRVLAGFFKWVEVDNTGIIQFQTAGFTQVGAARSDPDIGEKCEQLGCLLSQRIQENYG